MTITTETEPRQKRRWLVPTIIAAALVAVLVIALTSFLNGLTQKSASDADATPKPPASPSATVDPDFVQCRVDAVMAYMKTQGFEDGDFVIGEDNIDTSMPEFTETGTLGFGVDGQIVDSRKALQAVFDSSDENLQAVTNAQTAKFPELDKEVILDAENWEIVQSKVPVQVQGNTGFSNGTVVDMGLRNSAAGDAGWLFIDTELCTVPTASHTAAGEPSSSTTPDKEKPVGFIRVGCINPGDGFLPPPPPPTTPPTTPPPTNEPKYDSLNPYPRGEAPVGGGSNWDSGPGVYTPPLPQPTSQPRVDPPPPATEPAPAPPTVTPSPAPATPPTVDTGEQDNDGTVPEEGGANCNPDFQNCP